MNNNKWRLLVLPSTYGAVVWFVLLFFVAFGVSDVIISTEAWLIFVYVVLSFLISNFYWQQQINDFFSVFGANEFAWQEFDVSIFIISSIVGFFGIYKYIVDFSLLLSQGGFFFNFLNNPLAIRAAAVEETSIGFQLSYFSWLAFAYSVSYFSFALGRNRGVYFYGAIIYSLIIFFLNLLFIDRTRPILLFLTAFLIYFSINFERIKNPGKMLAYLSLGPVGVFFLLALFTGKYNQSDGLVDNFLSYVFGGFGYFSDSLLDKVDGFSLERTFLPFAKLFSKIGFISAPPSEILEFKAIPFLTNVGTFLQPLVADGGIFLVFIFTPILIFALDSIAVMAYRSSSVTGLFVWSNVVGVVILSFFVAKFNSTYFYLFCFVHGFLNFFYYFLRRNNLFDSGRSK